MSKGYLPGFVFAIVIAVILFATGLIKAPWEITVAGGIVSGLVLGVLWRLLFLKKKATQEP